MRTSKSLASSYQVPAKMDTVGFNDILAGTIIGTGETIEVKSGESRSDRSKAKRPLRGAPPSSLSQPITTDRSRSSSPSKTNRISSLPISRHPSPSKTQQVLTSTRPPVTLFSKSTSSNDLSAEGLRSSTQRGRCGNKGRAVAFKHHRFLPHTSTITPPSTMSFQPHFQASEDQLLSSSYQAFEFKTLAPILPTMNINVSGEILLPPTISQQTNTTPPSATVEHFSSRTSKSESLDAMSSTVESTSTWTFHPGSERGYENSPMVKLVQQYKEDSNDDDTSTWLRATTLSSKKTLLVSDIVERRGLQQTYALYPTLLEEVTRVVSELQIFLERTSALIPERMSHFKVDLRDTFISILRESSDLGQIHAAWMGLTRRLTLALENLVKYEIQYKGPIEGREFETPASPISMDVGIYEAIEGEEDRDFRMRYIYENVPHHQDQICSPRKLRDGTAWSSIIPLPNSTQDTTLSTLPTIPERENSPNIQEVVTSKPRDKGKRRITDKFLSPPTSPRVMNIGYGTPFKSSSQFFVRPGIPLPPSEILSQKSVLLGLRLPQTPAFENIVDVQNKDTRNMQKPLQLRASNPFKGRDLPPHMNTRTTGQIDNTAYLPVPMSSHQNSSPSHNSQFHWAQDERSEGDLSTEQRSGSNRRNPAGGDPDDDDEGDDDDDEHPRRGRNPSNRDPPDHNRPSNPNGGGGGGHPGGGGGGDGLNGGGYQPNIPQANIPYGNLVSTIRNELKQDQLPVWDGNKDTAIEYFWKIQQLAALEGDIPVALGFWLWKSLKENSKIWMWFTTLPFSEQAKMRTHYLHYLKGIKDNYLGRSWHISMNRKYENQSFRQEGFERESPPAFIVRRIMYT